MCRFDPTALVALLLLTWTVACTGEMGTSDTGPGGEPDAGTSPDGSSPDGSPSDGGTPSDGGAPPPTDWPVPIPGSTGAGPACPEPLQVAPGSDWPEVFVGIDGCDDAGPGSRETPFCTFARAFEVADSVPGIVTVLDGTYRQRGHNVFRRGTADAYFMIRADEGAHPVILGSSRIEGASFEAVGDGTYRADVSGLENDPMGLWTESGRRIQHPLAWRDDVRSHGDLSEISEPGEWTKADASGAGCGRDNTGCFIYIRPYDDMDVTATAFEASQGSFFYAGGSDFMVVDGISTKFTQSEGLFFENATNIVIQNGDFAHNANGNDNSYNLRLWGADGAIVRWNRVHDSRYWGGAINSHGITFMIAGEDQDIWVCENEVFDSIGIGISTKGGTSNIHVVGNWLHDLGTGVKYPDPRCHWMGCDVRRWGSGGYDVRENLFENCRTGFFGEDRQEGTDPAVRESRVYNNLFVDVARGVEVARKSTFPMVRNNVFSGGASGIYFKAGGETTWPDYYLDRGFDSANNLFATDDAIYVQANWSGSERGMTLAEYQSEYGGEASSIEGEPGMDERYRPLADSPLRNAGDASLFEGADSVHIGLWPFAE